MGNRFISSRHVVLTAILILLFSSTCSAFTVSKVNKISSHATNLINKSYKKAYHSPTHHSLLSQRHSLKSFMNDDESKTLPSHRISGDIDKNEPLLSPRRMIYLILWIGLLVYAFGYSPGGSEAASAIDNELILGMLSTPFDGKINPLFVSLFNSLGVIPLINASLLLPGAKGQKIPALPFVMGSLALGFFGIGPYLCLRNLKTDVLSQERGRGSAIFEFKGTSLALLGFSLFLVYYALSGIVSDGNCLGNFIELFKSQRLVHISTIDFTILSLAMSDPLSEDMKRRAWKGPSATVTSALPMIGPVLYLLLRNPLPETKEETTSA